ncbi:hypothetical protein [Lacinutrix sp.]|uniref:hypothetical protein n=1 Tax=Lacinutrix sp. TaxID=1937692 RepID=UPI0025BB547A|nr:hypothetical protein [Lacinutrix sp.]
MRIKYINMFALCLIMLFSCSSVRNITTKELEIKANEYTTYFYSPIASILNKKKEYLITERKNFDIRLINMGTKELFVPNPIANGHEISIKLFRKNELDKYIAYVQKSKIAISNSHAGTSVLRRNIDSIKNGKPLIFKNLQVDPNIKIVDKGSYYAKIEIDLAKFGYFRIIKTEFYFEVK